MRTKVYTFRERYKENRQQVQEQAVRQPHLENLGTLIWSNMVQYEITRLFECLTTFLQPFATTW